MKCCRGKQQKRGHCWSRNSGEYLFFYVSRKIYLELVHDSTPIRKDTSEERKACLISEFIECFVYISCAMNDSNTVGDVVWLLCAWLMSVKIVAKIIGRVNTASSFLPFVPAIINGLIQHICKHSTSSNGRYEIILSHLLFWKMH